MTTKIRKKKRPSNSSVKNPVKVKRAERAVREVSAGGVVYRKIQRGIQFAVMLDSYGKWAFPKGHVEKGETHAGAAARETMEELGLRELRLVRPLGKIDIWFRDKYERKGRLIHKDIHYFLFETPAEATLLPNPMHRAFKAKWVASADILQTSSYTDMIPILKRAIVHLTASETHTSHKRD